MKEQRISYTEHIFQCGRRVDSNDDIGKSNVISLVNYAFKIGILPVKVFLRVVKGLFKMWDIKGK